MDNTKKGPSQDEQRKVASDAAKKPKETLKTLKKMLKKPQEIKIAEFMEKIFSLTDKETEEWFKKFEDQKEIEAAMILIVGWLLSAETGKEGQVFCKNLASRVFKHIRNEKHPWFLKGLKKCLSGSVLEDIEKLGKKVKDSKNALEDLKEMLKQQPEKINIDEFMKRVFLLDDDEAKELWVGNKKVVEQIRNRLSLAELNTTEEQFFCTEIAIEVFKVIQKDNPGAVSEDLKRLTKHLRGSALDYIRLNIEADNTKSKHISKVRHEFVNSLDAVSLIRILVVCRDKKDTTISTESGSKQTGQLESMDTFLLTELDDAKRKELIGALKEPDDAMRKLLAIMSPDQINKILQIFPLTQSVEVTGNKILIEALETKKGEQRFNKKFQEEVGSIGSDRGETYIEQMHNSSDENRSSAAIAIAKARKEPNDDEKRKLALYEIFEKYYKDFRSSFIIGISKCNDMDITNLLQYVDIESLTAIAAKIGKDDKRAELLGKVIKKNTENLAKSISGISQAIKSAEEHTEGKDSLQKKKDSLEKSIKILFVGIDPLDVLKIIAGLGSKEDREFFMQSLELSVAVKIADYLFPGDLKLAEQHAIELRNYVSKAYVILDASKEKDKDAVTMFMGLFSGKILNKIRDSLQTEPAKKDFTKKTSEHALRMLAVADEEGIDIILQDGYVFDFLLKQKALLQSIKPKQLALIYKCITKEGVDSKLGSQFVSVLSSRVLCGVYEELSVIEKEKFVASIPFKSVLLLVSDEENTELAQSELMKNCKAEFQYRIMHAVCEEIKNKEDKTEEVTLALEQVSGKCLSKVIKAIGGPLTIKYLNLSCILKLIEYEANEPNGLSENAQNCIKDKDFLKQLEKPILKTKLKNIQSSKKQFEPSDTNTGDYSGIDDKEAERQDLIAHGPATLNGVACAQIIKILLEAEKNTKAFLEVIDWSNLKEIEIDSDVKSNILDMLCLHNVENAATILASLDSKDAIDKRLVGWLKKAEDPNFSKQIDKDAWARIIKACTTESGGKEAFLAYLIELGADKAQQFIKDNNFDIETKKQIVGLCGEEVLKVFCYKKLSDPSYEIDKAKIKFLQENFSECQLSLVTKDNLELCKALFKKEIACVKPDPDAIFVFSTMINDEVFEKFFEEDMQLCLQCIKELKGEKLSKFIKYINQDRMTKMLEQRFEDKDIFNGFFQGVGSNGLGEFFKKVKSENFSRFIELLNGENIANLAALLEDQTIYERTVQEAKKLDKSPNALIILNKAIALKLKKCFGDGEGDVYDNLKLNYASACELLCKLDEIEKAEKLDVQTLGQEEKGLLVFGYDGGTTKVKNCSERWLALDCLEKKILESQPANDALLKSIRIKKDTQLNDNLLNVLGIKEDIKAMQDLIDKHTTENEKAYGNEFTEFKRRTKEVIFLGALKSTESNGRKVVSFIGRAFGYQNDVAKALDDSKREFETSAGNLKKFAGELMGDGIASRFLECLYKTVSAVVGWISFLAPTKIQGWQQKLTEKAGKSKDQQEFKSNLKSVQNKIQKCNLNLN